MLACRPLGRLARLVLVLAAVLPATLLAADDDVPGDGPRLMREAGAAEKGGRLAEARQLYLDAAKEVPLLGDWLLRRAARLTPDSATRWGMLERIRTPLVAARILAADAEARELAGDLPGAILRYDSLGQVGNATRLRLRLARTAAQRTEVRRALVAALKARPAVATLDALFTAGLPLTAQEALVVARAATELRQPAREAALYHRAFAAGLGTSEDRLAYGVALNRTRRYTQAITALGRITTASPLAPRAQWERALAEIRLGRDAVARATLARLMTRYPKDEVIPSALFLAGGVESRLGNAEAARKIWRDLATRFPESDSAGRAGFLAALSRWESGDKAGAAEDFVAVHQRNPGSDGQAAGYWAGRTYDELGDRPRAELFWQSVVARDPLSYYASVSARRLGVAAWQPVAARDTFAFYSDVGHALRRIQLLTEGELAPEAAWEREGLLAAPDSSAERLLAIADGYRKIGQPSAAVSIARRAQARGAPADARTYRLLYPLYYADELERQASATGLDPLVVAALIRQESAWEPRARSRAGALGLMQVMPETGRLLARTLKLPGWSTDQLHDPAVNLQLGTHYLATRLDQFDGDLARALAAYNAGAGRVPLWAVGAAAADPDLFVEKITFAETRDYVRIVQRNVAIYRALYGTRKAARVAEEATGNIN